MPNINPSASTSLHRAWLKDAWQIITWREAVDQALPSRFARLRLRPAHRDHQLNSPPPQAWLPIEWPRDEDQPTKYWCSTLPVDIACDKMVTIVKLRWRIERDYQELKQAVGLGHYEGRSWRGFHPHATRCIAAYGFLICERATFPPARLAATTKLKKLAVPNNYRSRDSAHSS
jgi:SRSO17 transposase